MQKLLYCLYEMTKTQRRLACEEKRQKRTPMQASIARCIYKYTLGKRGTIRKGIQLREEKNNDTNERLFNSIRMQSWRKKNTFYIYSVYILFYQFRRQTYRFSIIVIRFCVCGYHTITVTVESLP